MKHERQRLTFAAGMLACCLTVFGLAAPGFPDSDPLAPRTDMENQFVSIDFQDVDIHVFVKFISELTGRNFVIDNQVKGKVTIISPAKISVAEAYRVFESVLEVHGYTAVQAGRIYKIVPMSDARTKSVETRLREEARSPDDKVVTQLIPLRYAAPEEVKRLLTPLVSKSSVILSYPPTNTIIVTDISSNVQRLLRILKVIDIPGIGLEISVIPLEHANAEKLTKLLDTVFRTEKSPNANEPEKTVRFVADARTNTMILLASAADTARVQQLIRMLDRKAPTGKEKIHVYYLKNATADELSKVLEHLIANQAAGTKNGQEGRVVAGSVQITADKATNSLIIRADKEDYLIIEEIIAKLDIPRAMVYIESLIMEVDVNADFNIGTEWIVGGETNYGNRDAVFGGGFSGGASGGDTGYGTIIPPIPGAVAPLPPGFSIGIFGEPIEIAGVTFPSIAAVASAYQKDSAVNILSTPQILTTDNEEAKIVVGQNIPYQTTATTTNNDTFNSFEYRDVGKTLRITPHISQDRMIRLNISLEVTVLEDPNDNRPTTLKRTIDTTVLVKDKSTIVIGGLIDHAFSNVEYRVPCLGDIPIVGWLFKSLGKRNQKTNLYIFLSPRVVQGHLEAEEIYRQKKEQIDSVQGGEIKLYDPDAPLMEKIKE